MGNGDKAYASDGYILEIEGRRYTPRHLTPTQLIELGLLDEQTLNDYFAFTFVRNPWDRLVSIFISHHKPFFPNFRSYVIEVENIIKRYMDGKSLLFNRRKNAMSDMFLQPQIGFIKYNEKNVMDFVGRFENFEEDYEKLCNMLNIPVIHHHKRQSDRLHYSKYYNDHRRDLIANLYKEDIDFFGYKFEESD